MIDSADNLLPDVTALAADVMAVEDVMVGSRAGAFRTRTDGRRPDPDALLGVFLDRAGAMAEAVRIRGRLLLPSEQAYARLSDGLRSINRTPVLRRAEDGHGEVLVVLPGQIRKARPNIRLAGLLFGLTVLSCLYTGALYAENGASFLPANLLDGLPFAASLLGILLAHEFGHYIVSRRLGVPASLPYFIPMPLSPFGTFGAVINMVAPPRNRRQMLAIGAAGPLAGLVVALPVLWYGLSQSPVGPLPTGPYSLEGNSILYAVIKYLQFGRWLPGGGFDVSINSVAFAGWVGLFVTALNLMPAGQLDGGHILNALAGERVVRGMLWGVLGALAVVSLLDRYSGWLLWMALLFIFGRILVPPLDDVTTLTSGQRALAVLMLIVFVLVFTPLPMTFVQ